MEQAGFGEWFVHRTGHSIDRDLHGSGPHLDDYETHDDRRLGPGIGFSVEPGVYLPGEFGVRSEVNMYWGSGRAGGDPGRAAGAADHELVASDESTALATSYESTAPNAIIGDCYRASTAYVPPPPASTSGSAASSAQKASTRAPNSHCVSSSLSEPCDPDVLTKLPTIVAPSSFRDVRRRSRKPT